MADLYPILMKNVKQGAFGATLSNIVALQKQGEVGMKAKKLLMTYNGDKYASVDCQSVTLNVEDDTILLDIVLMEDEEHSTENTSQVKEDVPQTEAVIPASITDTFALQGDDLESFELLSDFHKTENCDQKTEGDELIAHTLESGVFNIQDLSSVQNAVLDIIEKEKQFIDQGYKVFKSNTPRFDYENDSNFKLVESVVLIAKTVKKENNL